MKNMKRQYNLLTGLFLLLGVIFSIILTYNYYADAKALNIFCAEDSYIDCAKVSQGKYSSIYGIPISVFGLAFYIAVLLYHILPRLDSGYKNLLIPYAFLLVVANVVDVMLFFLSVIVIGAFCTQCFMIYLANIGLFITFYIYELKGKIILDEIKEYLANFKKDKAYRNKLIIYTIASVVCMFLLIQLSEPLSKTLVKKDIVKGNKISQTKDNTKPLPSKGNEGEVESLSEGAKEFYTRPASFNTKAFGRLPYFGNESAPIEVLVFHDLQCPICQISFNDFEESVKGYQPNVKIKYANFAFKGSGKHSQMTSAELAAYSWYAFERNRYREFLLSLFSKFQKEIYIDKDEIKDSFAAAGIKDEQSKLDKSSSKYLDTVKEQANTLRSYLYGLGYRQLGTPTFIINDRLVGFGYNKEVLLEILEEEIRRLKK